MFYAALEQWSDQQAAFMRCVIPLPRICWGGVEITIIKSWGIAIWRRQPLLARLR
jgi:hypothetical protein